MVVSSWFARGCVDVRSGGFARPDGVTLDAEVVGGPLGVVGVEVLLGVVAHRLDRQVASQVMFSGSATSVTMSETASRPSRCFTGRHCDAHGVSPSGFGVCGACCCALVAKDARGDEEFQVFCCGFKRRFRRSMKRRAGANASVTMPASTTQEAG